MPLGQQLVHLQHGWRGGAGAHSTGSSGPSSPLHLVGSLDGGSGSGGDGGPFRQGSLCEGEDREALDDAAAAGTALAAAGSLDDGWRADPGALFRSGSAGTLIIGGGGNVGGSGGAGIPGGAGSISAPGSATAAPGNAARLIPGGVSIWSYQPADAGKPGGLGLGTSPVARVLFPQGGAASVDSQPPCAGFGGGKGAPQTALPDGLEDPAVQRRSGCTAAQLLPTEGELLMAMAAAEAQEVVTSRKFF
jgi:hypothetical protein